MIISKIGELDSKRSEVVGGKARGLDTMAKHGINIAKCFVLSEIDLKKDRDELISFYNSLDFKSVAVRSSATLEDGSLFSSAGQYQSFLNITDCESFLNAIVGCLSSLNQEEIKKYIDFFNLDKSNMNIVVQEMIDPIFSGVGFSINPIDQSDFIIIETVEGLGEKLVSGAVNSTRISVDKKSKEYQCDLLPQDALNLLIDNILALEKIYQTPIDVEWAIDHNNTLFMLQVRPITTITEVSINELDNKHILDTDVITNHNVGEMLPNAITPLSISTVVASIDYGIRVMLKKAGTIKDIKEVENDIVITVYNHLFFNMKHIYKLGHSVIGASRKSVDIGICGQELEIKELTVPKKVHLFKKLLNGIGYFRFILGRNKAIKRSEDIIFNLNFIGDNIENLNNSINNNIKYLNDTLINHYQVSGYSGAMIGAIFQILTAKGDYSDEQTKALIAELLRNIDGVESADIIISLKSLARSILDINENILDCNNRQLEKFIYDNKVVNEEFEEFLRKHGHRTIRESELRSVSWASDIDSLMDYLRAIIISVKNNPKAEEVIDKDEYLRTLDSIKCKGKRALKFLVKQARNACRLREKSKSQMIKVVDKFKTAYKRLSKLLVEEKYLIDEDLIYFLTKDELNTFIQTKDSKYIKLSSSRRRLLKEQSLLKFEHVSRGKPTPIKKDISTLPSDKVLTGSSLSKGVVEGRARVINSIAEAKELLPGEIMIAGYTDIGWSVYFSLIGGLVTEVGSALSHGAVVAREHSLPLVSNVKNATELIKTGDLILLDANNGSIAIIG